MIVFRLSRNKYKHDLSGIGASIRGARWNSKGTSILYTASNRSLTMAEVVVHISLEFLPENYYMIEIFVPDYAPMLIISEYELPKYWNSFQFQPFELKKIGNDFIQNNKYLVLQIPSVVTKDDYNFLINPKHPLFKKVKIINTEKFPFDHRLFEKKK